MSSQAGSTSVLHQALFPLDCVTGAALAIGKKQDMSLSREF